jgi:hypothetical protein
MTAPSAVLSGTNVFAAGDFLSSKIRTFGATFNNSGTAVATGTKSYLIVPVAIQLVAWYLFCDTSATLTVDVWSTLLASAPPTVSNSIVGNDIPTITAATQASDTNLMANGWNNTASPLSTALLIPAGSALVFNVKTNNNATIIRCELLATCGS